jgi:UDPglucose--hexose-1-phosphate uridylyltransferase
MAPTGNEFYSVRLRKSDGRALTLYARHPLPEGMDAPSPDSGSLETSSHLRWHPFRQEWVVYAGSRQNRTFLPGADKNPLAPTVPGSAPTELPSGAYDVAVFDNKFPAFSEQSGAPPKSITETASARGACEVVVFTQDPNASLGSLPLDHIELILEVWADRYRELGTRDDIAYVYIFENRGSEVGVTLHHPHAQIYAYPFVPPIPARELEAEAAHIAADGRGLLEAQIEAELRDGKRVLYSADCVAFVPSFARYAYEVWLAPKRRVASLVDLTDAERADFAIALKTVLLTYDTMWDAPFPYIMAMHQAPVDGKAYPGAHLHMEFYPAYRMKGRLKFLAGSELGAGVFTADVLPEQSAQALLAAKERIRV